MATVDTQKGLDIPDGVELVYSEASELPVGVRDNRKLTSVKKIVLFLIALAAAAGWGTIATSRGETVNAVWLVMAAVGSYIGGVIYYWLHFLRSVGGIQDS